MEGHSRRWYAATGSGLNYGWQFASDTNNPSRSELKQCELDNPSLLIGQMIGWRYTYSKQSKFYYGKITGVRQYNQFFLVECPDKPRHVLVTNCTITKVKVITLMPTDNGEFSYTAPRQSYTPLPGSMLNSHHKSNPKTLIGLTISWTFENGPHVGEVLTVCTEPREGHPGCIVIQQNISPRRIHVLLDNESIRISAPPSPQQPVGVFAKPKPTVPEGMTLKDISDELYRIVSMPHPFDEKKRVDYRIDAPQWLLIPDKGNTLRIIDISGTVHLVPGPGYRGAAHRWQPRDTSKPVQF